MERIKRLLAEAGISDYIVYGYTERTAELFFVKKQLDTRRIKDVEKFVVTVFRTDEQDGKKLRAATDVTVLAAMTDAELLDAFKGAYFAAQFAMNPYYELPDPVQAPTVEAHGRLTEQAPEQSAGEMAAALFKADCEPGAFLNSAEVFVIQKHAHVISSRGADVSWVEAEVKGEYVVQAKEPEDVEMYRDFAYTELNTDALSAQAKEALSFVRDRALLENGVMRSTHGSNRFCRYLGAEPTGDYRKYSCDNPGTMSFAEMQKRPCLWAVTFSGFEMDSFSGHFGGEIRLAYLIEDGKMTPVTGGSINGSILEAQKDLVFSTDRYAEIGYDGPYAILLKNVAVAGTDGEA